MNENLGKNIETILKSNYVIPLYQRNFAWREEEITQLLQDIFETYCRNRGQNYYIGSLVVLKRHDGRFEVIDGQQRLTTLSLIAKILGRDGLPVLSYDSRPDVENFFEVLYSHPEKIEDLTAPEVFYLKEALRIIREANVICGNCKLDLSQNEFKKYFMEKVFLVFVELPDDTDVASYFEIMNNRGEQLNAHEVVKAMMMAKIENKGQQREFAKIWDACSQIDIPIQRLFSAEDRRKYFGDDYDNFIFQLENTLENNCPIGTDIWPSLNDILMADARQVYAGGESATANADTLETDVYVYNSIIDFPNFLMHVLRLYLSNKTPKIDVPLNEKELLNEYKKYQNDINPIDFANRLLFCRTAFDRFVVKTAADADDLEDGRKWVLLKPQKYPNNWKFINSFEKEDNNKLIKALSMLQVTFRNRIYKTWLYDVLKWLHEKYQQEHTLSFGADAYLDFLHRWMRDYYTAQHFDIRKLPEVELPSRSNSYSLGVGTPHFLLNFVDYLYCCSEPAKNLPDFDFKYWNSVEHHLAQHKAVGEAGQYVDCLGNLYLISRSANSRLSDRDVKEKVTFYKDKKMGPNRQIIYAETAKANYEWGGKQIAEHYNEIVDLLNNRLEILGLDKGI